MTEYKTVNLTSEEGFTIAENLASKGWIINYVGFSTIQFYREVDNEVN